MWPPDGEPLGGGFAAVGRSTLQALFPPMPVGGSPDDGTKTYGGRITLVAVCLRGGLLFIRSGRRALFAMFLASAAFADAPPPAPGKGWARTSCPCRRASDSWPTPGSPTTRGRCASIWRCGGPPPASRSTPRRWRSRRLALSGPGGAVAVTHRAGDRGRLDVAAAAPAAARPLRPGDRVRQRVRHPRHRPLQGDGGRRRLPLHPVRGGRGAAGLSRAGTSPSFKIPYQMTVVVPEAHVAVSNTPVGLGHGEGRAANGGLRAHAAAAVVPARARHRAAGVRAHPRHVRSRAAW